MTDMATNGSIQFVRTAAPLYRDVMTALERAIHDGLWKPGDQIPTESELEKLFGASRGTLRTAITELARKGLLHPQPGRGTFVLGPSFHSLERYFQTLIERIGSDVPIVPHNHLIALGTARADDAVAAALDVKLNSRVGYLRRVRHHQDEPFLIVDSYFPTDIWQAIKGADFEAHQLYDLFKEQFGLYVVSAEEFLQADLADDTEAGLLAIASRSAVIRLERTAYTFEERVLEYRRAVGRADRFRYHVRLK
jgi:GntR family transcriptional regulator